MSTAREFFGTPVEEIDLEMEAFYDQDHFDIPPAETGPFYCTICGKNAVDALNGYDTCDECLKRL
jgi:hypothetical protein